MNPQVCNGSGLGGQHLTDLLVFGFLQQGPSDNFQEELKGLGCALPMPTGPQEDCEENLVPPSLVDHLVMQVRDWGLSEEGWRECLATTVDQVLQACLRYMEEEETMLLVTMLLARKVASHTPSLLHKVFHTRVNFINQNLLTYVRNLVRNEMD
ncbi:BH3-interacting domain death agonist-like [Glossophaga mutica]